MLPELFRRRPGLVAPRRSSRSRPRTVEGGPARSSIRRSVRSFVRAPIFLMRRSRIAACTARHGMAFVRAQGGGFPCGSLSACCGFARIRRALAARTQRAVQEPVHLRSAEASGVIGSVDGTGSRTTAKAPWRKGGSSKGRQNRLAIHAGGMARIRLPGSARGCGFGPPAPVESRRRGTSAQARRASTRFRLFGCGGLAH